MIAVDIESLTAAATVLPCGHPALTYRHPKGKSRPVVHDCPVSEHSSNAADSDASQSEFARAWPGCRVTLVAGRPVGHGCEGPAWLLDVMAALAENKVRTDACLALTNPGPECTP